MPVLGLGVLEVDEKVFLFKRLPDNNSFSVDYSSDGCEFNPYSKSSVIVKNKKPIDISKTKNYIAFKKGNLYFINYLKKINDKYIPFSASSKDLIAWEEQKKPVTQDGENLVVSVVNGPDALELRVKMEGWKQGRTLWKRTNQWLGKKVESLGTVKLGDKIISYWEVESDIYAITHLNFARVLALHTELNFHPQLNKHGGNPLLEPKGDDEWESIAVFNPTAVYDEGKVHLVYRAVGDSGTSVWGYSNSEDGVNFENRESPIYLPRNHFELNTGNYCSLQHFSGGGGGGGCEDPRLTKIGDKYYVVYVAYDGRSAPKLALTSIDQSDFLNKNWDKWADPKIISKPGEAHKNWVIFPEKINGKYAILHSITPRVQIDYLDDLEFEDGAYIESHFSTTERVNCWDSFLRGPGPPPIATDDGWLVFYHAMDVKDYGRYKIGIMLLDYDKPEKILCRAKKPLIEPDRYYENNGYKPGVVFSCGSAIVGDMLFIYYGGSDTNVNVAYVYLPTFLNQLKATGSAQLNIT